MRTIGIPVGCGRHPDNSALACCATLVIDYHGTVKISEVSHGCHNDIQISGCRSRDDHSDRRVDLAGFRRWVLSPRFPEKVRASYIDGEIEVDMSPEEAHVHNNPKSQVCGALHYWIETHDLGQVFFDGMMLVNEAAEVANEPDFMFCLWDTLASGRAELRETFPGSGRITELVGTPDLVVEIVSPSSVTKDNVKLKERYALADIPEYWLIDGRGRTIKHEVLTLRGRKYRAVKPEGSGARRSLLLKAVVRLTRTKSPVNTWRNRLAIE